MNERNQLDLMDILNVLSFYIGLLNLQENLTQSDKQDLIRQFDTQTATILKELHKHLEVQDNKIDYILKRLEEM